MIYSGIVVFVGGGIGSVLRFLIAKYLNNSDAHTLVFPIGTILANIISCLILGFIIQKNTGIGISNNMKLLLITGFCGGFSTFSTFGYEIYLYLQKGELALGIGYTFASFVLGLLAIYVGIKLA